MHTRTHARAIAIWGTDSDTDKTWHARFTRVPKRVRTGEDIFPGGRCGADVRRDNESRGGLLQLPLELGDDVHLLSAFPSEYFQAGIPGGEGRAQICVLAHGDDAIAAVEPRFGHRRAKLGTGM